MEFNVSKTTDEFETLHTPMTMTIKELGFRKKLSTAFFKPREISLADFALVVLILGIIDITTFTIKAVLTLVFD